MSPKRHPRLTRLLLLSGSLLLLVGLSVLVGRAGSGGHVLTGLDPLPSVRRPNVLLIDPDRRLITRLATRHYAAIPPQWLDSQRLVTARHYEVPVALTETRAPTMTLFTVGRGPQPLYISTRCRPDVIRVIDEQVVCLSAEGHLLALTLTCALANCDTPPLEISDVQGALAFSPADSSPTRTLTLERREFRPYLQTTLCQTDLAQARVMCEDEIEPLSAGEEYAYSPDGTYLARMQYGVLPGILNIYRTSDRQLERQLTTPFHALFTPAWSPDGQHIAIFRSTASISTELMPLIDIAVLDVATGKYSTETFTGVPRAQPAWSPDSQRMAWLYYLGNDQTLLVWDQAAQQTTLLPLPHVGPPLLWRPCPEDSC